MKIFHSFVRRFRDALVQKRCGVFGNFRHRGRTPNSRRQSHGSKKNQLVSFEVLRNHNLAQNLQIAHQLATRRWPEISLAAASKLSAVERRAAGLHLPYKIAGVQFPYRFERFHVFISGKSGTGKTVLMSDVVDQVRHRESKAVIFDARGQFIERFFKADRDIILNPFDHRSPGWSFFDDIQTKEEIEAAAQILLPDEHMSRWRPAARALFLNTCLKLLREGRTENVALAEDLTGVEFEQIEASIAAHSAKQLNSFDVLEAEAAIRMLFHDIAAMLRVLEQGRALASIQNWARKPSESARFLFISSAGCSTGIAQSFVALFVNVALNASTAVNRPGFAGGSNS